MSYPSAELLGRVERRRRFNVEQKPVPSQHPVSPPRPRQGGPHRRDTIEWLTRPENYEDRGERKCRRAENISLL
jgi:hypothetical protein